MRALVLISGFLCGATSVLDMDFHWHVALGRKLVAGGFAATEPFSHLPVGVPDRQAWLADAALAVLDRIGGLALIRIILGVAFAAGCLSVFRLARRRTESLVVALLPVAVYAALGIARLRVRPDLFTLVLLPLFLELLERRPSWRRPFEVLLVSALWANIHPGSLIAGLLAIAQLWPFTRYRIANAVAAWAGLCVTPDGIHGLVRYTADTTLLRPLIPEWQRIWQRPFPEFAPEWAVIGVLILFCVAAAIVRTAGPRPAPVVDQARDSRGIELRDAALAVLGIGLAASAVRFLFALVLPALAAIRILGPVIAPRPLLRAAALVLVLVATVGLPCAHLGRAGKGLRAVGASFLGPEPPNYPVAAAEFVYASGLSGNLAHPARWGGYFAWKLPTDRFKTATDGRVTHFGPELAREWSEGVDSAAREEIFARRGIDLVIVPREMLPTFLDSQPYELLYADPLAVVLLRLEGPNQAENVRIRQAAEKERAKERLRRSLPK